MARSESQSSSRASWMFADPYTYQYSDIDVESDTNVLFPGQESGAPCELEGSTPTDVRYELPASPLMASVDDGDYMPEQPPKSPCGLSRNRPSSTRTIRRYSDRHGQASVLSAHTPPVQPSSSGLIPVSEDAAVQVQHFAPNTAFPPPYARPSLPAYAEGLIPVDENAMMLKEPSSDFDAILRNIGPIPKKSKGKIGRERSNRYNDRYSSNFG
ncbi:hypothetical protein F4678DRAFT_472081 [Xylaria arbuscula]|nr:hypothetical protein F4678DRAFT_472081 [Xylaria arbuscula]